MQTKARIASVVSQRFPLAVADPKREAGQLACRLIAEPLVRHEVALDVITHGFGERGDFLREAGGAEFGDVGAGVVLVSIAGAPAC